jgi:hypothetical protein
MKALFEIEFRIVMKEILKIYQEQQFVSKPGIEA